MGLLSLLGLGAAAPVQSADAAAPTPYTQGGDPMAYLTQGLPGYVPPNPSAAQDPNNPVAPATVTAHRTAKSTNGYDNNPELQAIQKVSQQYPDNSRGSGLGLSNMIPDAMPGAGTLRNVLGTLGDAFLIQSGHQPMHAQQRYDAQVAHAMAGFDTDPAAAAARIAATGAPGSAQLAEKLADTNNTYQLHKDQQQFNDMYRSGMLDNATQRTQSQNDSRQSQTDLRNRAFVHGALQKAAESGDPQQWAAARAYALKAGSKISDFDPDIEAPEDPKNYVPGFGMNANQVARQDTSNASIDERRQAAAQASADRRQRLNHPTANPTNYVQSLITRKNNGETLSPDETNYLTTHTTRPNRNGVNVATPPGYGSGGSNPGGPIHTYPSGRRAQWNGKQWVPIN